MAADAVYGFVGVLLGSVTTASLTVYRERLVSSREREARQQQREQDRKDQRDAFSSIREDLAHLYFMSYYPQPNPNRGWRTITVKLTNPKYKKYRIRTRSGYRPLPARVNVDVAGPGQ